RRRVRNSGLCLPDAGLELRRFGVNRGRELLIFDLVINRKLAVLSQAVILIVTRCLSRFAFAYCYCWPLCPASARRCTLNCLSIPMTPGWPNEENGTSSSS